MVQAAGRECNMDWMQFFRECGSKLEELKDENTATKEVY